MSEAYFEIMVKKQVSPVMKVMSLVTLILTCFFLFLGVIGFLPALLFGVAGGVAWYFLNLYRCVEFEYLYVDKELQIDRILGKTKRKRMETLDVSQLEVLAPIHSHQLDSYNRQKTEIKDYTSGGGKENPKAYAMVVAGKTICFEPTPELVKAIHMSAPRKVFTY